MVVSYNVCSVIVERSRRLPVLEQDQMHHSSCSALWSDDPGSY